MTQPGDPELAARLKRAIEGEVLFDAFSRGRYSTDASIYQVEPIGVVRPKSAADVEAALAGMGVGIASSWVVAEDIARGELLHLAPEWQASALPVYLVYPHARYYPARLRMFLALMKEVMPALSGTQHPGR